MPELSEDVRSWVCAALGNGARVVEASPLRDGIYLRVPWRLRIKTRAGDVEAILKIGPSDPDARRGATNVELRESFTNEAAGLQIADEHNLPAPRLLGLDLDGASGGLAILTTALHGHVCVPSDKLPAFGAAAAALHAIPISPANRPLRTRPRPSDDEVWLRRWAARYKAALDNEREQIVGQLLAEKPGWPTDGLHDRLLHTRTTPLIRAAEEHIAEFTPSEEPTVLVHADLCSGNTIWTDDRLVGIIDWESWGVGHYGVDLGNLRFEESFRFGPHAADEILRGWQEAMGREAADIAYWDLVAALNTPADMIRWSGGDPTATERRDQFLRAAIARFDRA